MSENYNYVGPPRKTQTMVTKSDEYLRKDNTKLLSVLFCGSWPFDSSDDSSGHKTIHSTGAISPRDSLCLFVDDHLSEASYNFHPPHNYSDAFLGGDRDP